MFPRSRSVSHNNNLAGGGGVQKRYSLLPVSVTALYPTPPDGAVVMPSLGNYVKEKCCNSQNAGASP